MDARRLMGLLLVVSACGSGMEQLDAGSDAAPADAPATSDAGTSDSGAPPLGPRGLYIPTFHQPIVGNANLEAQLALPYVDGFFVSRAWRDVETSPGTYSFASLHADLVAIQKAGKHATIGIGAGTFSPAYLCGDAGAQCLTMVVKAPQGAALCNQVVLPLPWDPVVQSRFHAMVQALAADVLGDATLASTVVDVKVTGFNDSNEETILPESHGGTTSCTGGNACVMGQCNASDQVSMLQGAGMSDSTAVTAFLSFARMFREAFPALPIGSQVSLSLETFGSTVPYDMVTAFVNDAGRPLTAQDQGLTATNGTDPGTLYAYEAGLPVGYQQLYSVVTPDGGPCPMSRGLAPDGGEVPCDESVMMAVVNNGITKGHASWIELYSTDVAAFPDAAATVHARLVGP